MAIQAISSIDFASLRQLSGIGQENAGDMVSFSDIFNRMLQNVQQTEIEAQQGLVDITTGNVDDLHTITMNIAKADLALQTMVQMRNKVMDAYNEVMRITL